MGRHTPGDAAAATDTWREASRRRPGLRRAAMCFLAVCAAPLILPYASGADEPSRQGWWWQGSQGGVSPPAPPDVPADGLYVQGGISADAPFAYAAVLFNLGQDQTAKKLTLHLAQSQLTNLSAAESRIRDADLAAESANLTKSQILLQAGIAALAQANSAPQQVLSLLKQ